jgi:hypothetical protein
MELYATDAEVIGWLVILGVCLVCAFVVFPLYGRHIANKEHRERMPHLYNDERLGGWD